MTRDDREDISTPEAGEGAPTTTASAATAVDTGERRRGLRLPIGPLALGPIALGPIALGLALALVLAAGLAILFGIKAKNNGDISAARTSALATANTYAVNLTTYDYRKVDDWQQQVLDSATGEFKEQFDKASDALKPLTTQYQATATGKVVDSAVKSANGERAEVLLFIDQSITNTTRKEPRVDRSRMVMTLVKSGDRWMITELQLV